MYFLLFSIKIKIKLFVKFWQIYNYFRELYLKTRKYVKSNYISEFSSLFNKYQSEVFPPTTICLLWFLGGILFSFVEVVLLLFTVRKF